MPATPVLSPLGLDCKLYYSTTFATPTRVLIERAINVSQPASKGKAELNSRMTRFKPKRPTLREVGLDFGYRYIRSTDAVFTALRGSFLTDTPLVFWVLDGLVADTGTQGWAFPGQVFDFPIDQQLEDGMVLNLGIDYVEYYESSVLIEPQWYVVS